jgi:hypothetical protein
MVAFVDLMRGGIPPLDAYRRLGGDPNELSPQTRSALVASPEVIGHDLAVAGGADWFELTDAQKREVIGRVRELARQNRHEPDDLSRFDTPPQ